MQDGRKDNGGNRPGSGRKSKAEELGLIGLIEDVVSEKERRAIIKKLAEKAKEGSFNHLQLYMAYYYGKPQEKINLSGDPDPRQIRFTGFHITEIKDARIGEK